MKTTKVCPKCRGIHILLIEGWAGGYGSGNNIPVGATIFSAVPVDRYVCKDCGYSEEWVRREDIEKLSKSKHART
jgi:ribosomal protein S27AE